MKGIVVEINNHEAIILSEDGLFKKIKNEDYAIGQSIRTEGKPKAGLKLIRGIAGLAAAFVICTIGAFAYFTPTDYVSLDVNPSVEYSLNLFDRILDVTAVNEDGEEILDRLDLDHMTIEAGVKATLDQLIADGYLSGDPDGGVVITASSEQPKEAERLASKLEQEVQTYLKDRKTAPVHVEAEAVTPQRVEEARELGVTPGKLNLVEKLQESTSGAIKKEEWLTKPVKDINKAIKDNRKMEKDGDPYENPKNDPENPWKNKYNDRDERDGWGPGANGGIKWNKIKDSKEDKWKDDRWDDQRDDRKDKWKDDRLKRGETKEREVWDDD